MPPSLQDTPTARLQPAPTPRVGAALRRLWWVPLITTVLGIGVGAWYAFSGAAEYGATALLRVNDDLPDRDLLGLPASDKPIDVLTAEVVVAADQPSTAERARERLRAGPDMSVDDVQSHTQTELNSDTGLVGVKAFAPSADEAQALANAYALAYVDLRGRSDRQRIVRARQALQEQIVERREQLRGADAELVGDDEQEPLEELLRQRQQLQLLARLQPPSVAMARPAQLGTAVGPSAAISLISGALLGFLVGAALVALREITDHRARSVDDLERVLGVPTLARVPRTRQLNGRGRFDALSRAEAEPFRLLLARLRYGPAADARTVTVTPVAAGDETTVAWYLAGAAAATGASTLLIRVDRGLDGGQAPGPGIGEILAGRAAVDEALLSAEVTSSATMDVLALDDRADEAQLLRVEPVHELLAWAHRTYDMTIIEAPAVVSHADAVPFVRTSDALVAVCRAGATNVEQVERLREAVSSLGSDFAGVVAVGFDGG